MASNSFVIKFFFLFVSSFAIIKMVVSGDPDILTDFVVPASKNNDKIDGKFFTFTDMRVVVGTGIPANFIVLKASMTEFPALTGQSVSYAVLEFPAGGVNPPHMHPRASELLFLFKGTLEVGFVDTTNKLYTQTLQEGDLFVFPKGLVHFQYAADRNTPTFAVSAFGSSNPGTVSVPKSVFTTGIDDHILAQSFKTNVATIKKLKAGLSPKP